jgi:hypothetical protein
LALNHLAKSSIIITTIISTCATNVNQQDWQHITKYTKTQKITSVGVHVVLSTSSG